MLLILVKRLFCPKGSETAKRSANVAENVPPSKTVECFDFYTEDDDFEYMSKVYGTKNTEASTSRAVKTFQACMSCHNAGKEKSATL